MKEEVRLRPEAEQDLGEAAGWYEQQQPGLGQQFLDEVTVSLSRISETPLAYPVVHRATRRALVKRFPFGIFYLVEGGEIVVVAILHGSRNPRTWKQRS